MSQNESYRACARFFVTGCDNAAPPLICEVFVTCHKKQFSAGKCFRYIPGMQLNPQTRMKHCVNVTFRVIFRVKVNVKIRPETSIPTHTRKDSQKQPKQEKWPKQPKQDNDPNRQWVRWTKITKKSEINQGFRKYKGLYKSDHWLARYTI
jgi:hypothetical protein